MIDIIQIPLSVFKLLIQIMFFVIKTRLGLVYHVFSAHMLIFADNMCVFGLFSLWFGCDAADLLGSGRLSLLIFLCV